MILTHVDIGPDARSLLAWLLHTAQEAADAAGFSGDWLPADLPSTPRADEWRNFAGNAAALRQVAGQSRRLGPDGNWNALTAVWLLASAVEQAASGVAHGDQGAATRRAHADIVTDPRWAGKWRAAQERQRRADIARHNLDVTRQATNAAIDAAAALRGKVTP